MAETDSYGNKQTRKKGFVPSDDDYQLCSIRITDADNGGVSLECGYELKQDAKDKAEKAASTGPMPYYGHDSETYVFEDPAKAQDYLGDLIAKRLSGVSAGDGTGDVDED